MYKEEQWKENILDLANEDKVHRDSKLQEFIDDMLPEIIQLAKDYDNILKTPEQLERTWAIDDFYYNILSKPIKLLDLIYCNNWVIINEVTEEDIKPLFIIDYKDSEEYYPGLIENILKDINQIVNNYVYRPVEDYWLND